MSALLVKQIGLIFLQFKFEKIEENLNAHFSLETYYGNCEGVETVTLCIRGTDGKEALFVVPKLDLTRASPVFQRMFANEMTEKSSGNVVIEDTNAEEFGHFLKAISPKQEQPNRKFNN
jgi:hypothetical protein